MAAEPAEGRKVAVLASDVQAILDDFDEEIRMGSLADPEYAPMQRFREALVAHLPHWRDGNGVCRFCNRCSDSACCGPTDESCLGALS